MENQVSNSNIVNQALSQADKRRPTMLAKDAAAKIGIGKSQSLFTLLLVSFTAGILIASYVLALGLFISRKKHTSTAGDAAIEAAKMLSDITVEHPSTGPLRLCNWRQKESLFFDQSNERTRSFGSIKANYAKIKIITEALGLEEFRYLLSRDEISLASIEKELRHRLDRAIQPTELLSSKGGQSDSVVSFSHSDAS